MIEQLEARKLLSVPAFTANTTFVFAAGGGLSPPFTPAQITKAYGVNGISFGSTAGNGAGQTIAIIDAFNDPNIVSDVSTFNTRYSLPQFNVAGGPTFTVLNQNGATSPLPSNATPGDWDVEESLDVEWAHSIAPQANIILFEASSNNNNLYTAVDTAANTPGVSVITMSWGGGESSSDTSFNSDFTTPAGHIGITFLASTGDDAAPGDYPAYSPNVVAVGGTSLTINADGTYGGETGWADSGGGVSSVESQPTYQNGKVNGTSSTKRATPDVAWLADPNTGVAVYDSYYGKKSSNLYQVGGTSLSSPMWAGLIAIADQGRVLAGEPTLDGPSQTLPLLYNISASDFHDITSGSNGHSATTGYDLVTGRGSPVPGAIVNDLVNTPTIYVDANAPGPTFNGSSWATAFTSLQSALAVAAGGDRILVGQGTYYPSSNGSRTATFQLISGVDIIGGYAGYGTTNPNTENPLAYPTVLSGDIGAAGNSSDNSYHVISSGSVSTVTLVQGFTITQGNANGSSTNSDGGAVLNAGGGAEFIDCTFFDNSATTVGGAVYDSSGSQSYLNCVFVGNTAPMGGGVYATSASEDFINCTFTTNSVATSGRAIFESFSTATLINCILWGDTGGGSEIGTGRSSVSVSYSDVQGGFGGTGNINSDPLFITVPLGGGTGNLQLESASPTIDVGNNAAIPVFISTDAGGNPRIVDYPGDHDPGAIVDMGAYEAQVPGIVSASVMTPDGAQFTSQFSQNISSTLTSDDVQITALTGGPASSITGLTYDTGTNIAAFSFSSNLPVGIYQVDVGAAEAHLATDYIFTFVYLPTGSSLSLSGEQFFTVQQFYMGSNTTLDIGNDAIVVQYSGNSPAPAIGLSISAGYNNSQTDGPKILSSMAGMGNGVGYFDNGSALTIRRTWNGDTNLDGTINADDLSLMMLGQSAGGTRWQDGNFNYDSQVDADDWFLLLLAAAISNGQSINSTAMSSGVLPASRSAVATAPAISSGVFSNLMASIDSRDDLLM